MTADTRVQISTAGVCLPEGRRRSDQVEAMIVAASAPGVVPRRGREDERDQGAHLAAAGVHGSDLAAGAARDALRRGGAPLESVDLLIFASAGQDLAEPATANIVQQKLGTRAAVFDVKNACNSFLNGIQVAESLILSGAYRRALVVAGEVPSRAIRWDARRPPGPAPELPRLHHGGRRGRRLARAGLGRPGHLLPRLPHRRAATGTSPPSPAVAPCTPAATSSPTSEGTGAS